MKIAIDISQIAYEATGVANYTKELVTNLLALDNKNKYLLFAYSLRKKQVFAEFFTKLNASGFKFEKKIFNFPQKIGNLIWNKIHVYPLEKLVGGIDIYHSSDWIQIPAKCKKITTVHDLVVYKYPETSDPYIVETQKKRLSHVKNECQIILSDSKATKDDLVNILNFSPNKIKVVYPGISADFYKTNSGNLDILSKYNISEPYILTVGTNDPRKNFNTLIRAFNNLNNNNLTLLIVSKAGWGEELKLNKKIKLINEITTAELALLYNHAKIFVYPSLYEGFGLPLVEAFASGCPVITSNRGSLKEVAENSALIIDPENESEISHSIIKVLKNKELREDLIQKGKQRAQVFSWQKSAEKIIKIYENLN